MARRRSRVRMLEAVISHEHFADHGGQAPVGEVVSLPKPVADDFVAAGYAERVQQSRSARGPKRNTKAAGPSETRS